MQNRITEILNIQYPIVQGAMSWVTNAEFVAVVSNAGGLGILGPHGSYTTNPSSMDEIIERMRNEIRKIKTLGGVLKSMLTLNEAIIDVKEG